ncbi:MAG TPA: metal-sensitive transcriptional regulator [Gemmatimonas sp.]|uniref:metal-sensitive transcriptional regulator n=1 Tax=Gemmatimonas sp. TaxID=1962908 RepID=UPI002ED7DFF6
MPRTPRTTVSGEPIPVSAEAETAVSSTVSGGHRALHIVGCGCGTRKDEGDAMPDGRKAIAVDSDAKQRNQKRLRRIEGQVRGLQKMVDEDRYCADILTQIASVHEALRAVGRELMRNHLKHCATAAIQRSPDEAEAMYDELVEMMYRNSR